MQCEYLRNTTSQGLKRIAIHDQPGSFSDRWVEYCQSKGIDYKLVNCFDSAIIEQLKDCQYLLWNWDLSYKGSLDARTVIMAAEKMGLKVFPNVSTCWHYDDKVAQMYLLQSIDAPLVKSYIFYD